MPQSVGKLASPKSLISSKVCLVSNHQKRYRASDNTRKLTSLPDFSPEVTCGWIRYIDALGLPESGSYFECRKVPKGAGRSGGPMERFLDSIRGSMKQFLD